MFRRVLIANRGEIAVRIIRTLREMGLTSIAVFSDADRQAPFVDEADEAYRLGPSSPGESYLNIAALLDVASVARAEAVHPGYGFLSENVGFAEAVTASGLAFIGPSPGALRTMGDKVAARRAAAELGVPCVPGSPGPVKSLDVARQIAADIGFPLAVKAAGGGGGRGIRIIRREEDLAGSLDAASREAAAYFNNPDVYIERYFPSPRHVEVQVLGDSHGTLVHLGERDCSVQRRHQKLIEESPSPAVDHALRRRMGEMALRIAHSVHYASAGTVEFLLAPDGRFYFLEMNTRIQVEHPVTEWVTGVDLIQEMILAAAGERITVPADTIDLAGHALEVRINAEDPHAGFRPNPDTITAYQEPGGPGTRVDSGVRAGYTLPREYDSLMSKLIVWAPDRDRALSRARRALAEYRIAGPSTTIPFSTAILQHPEFVAGRAATSFLEEHGQELLDGPLTPVARPAPPEQAPTLGESRSFDVEVNRRMYRVRVAELKAAPKTATPSRRPASPSPASAHSQALLSPMHGTIVAVRKDVGDQVEAGETVILIEAMKMEMEIAAHRSGRLMALHAAIGDTVERDQELALIE